MKANVEWIVITQFPETYQFSVIVITQFAPKPLLGFFCFAQFSHKSMFELIQVSNIQIVSTKGQTPTFKWHVQRTIDLFRNISKQNNIILIRFNSYRPYLNLYLHIKLLLWMLIFAVQHFSIIWFVQPCYSYIAPCDPWDNRIIFLLFCMLSVEYVLCIIISIYNNNNNNKIISVFYLVHEFIRKSNRLN